VYAVGSEYPSGLGLICLDTLGNIGWLKTIAPNGNGGHAITIDSYNNIIVAGVFYDSLTIDSLSLYQPQDNAFIAKFDLNGNILTLKLLATHTKPNAIYIDQSGNCYLTGQINHTAVFNSFTLNSLGLRDIFIAKYDPNWNCIWVRQAGSNGPESEMWDDRGSAIQVSPSGSVYVAGSCIDTSAFGTLILPGYIHTEDAFVAKYDTNGVVDWVKRFGNGSDDEGRCLTLDNSENIYVGGCHVYPITFGSTILPYIGNFDLFVAKLDSAGNNIWAVNAGGATWNEAANGITLDNNNDVIFTGMFDDQAYFGNDTLHCNNFTDMYIAKITNPLTSVESLSSPSDISIFPNPTSSGITIVSGENIKMINVYSVIGEKEYSEKPGNSYQVSVDLKEFTKGIYLVEIITENGRTAKKIIKN
jgi:hypothetical protein